MTPKPAVPRKRVLEEAVTDAERVMKMYRRKLEIAQQDYEEAIATFWRALAKIGQLNRKRTQ